MKKTIFTFFVACNLAISGFFAVLATSPALAAECPLCDAVEKNNIAEVRRLLDDGANPNQANADGFTTLMVAAFAGHSQIAKALLDGGANPNQAAANGGTALMIAAFEGHLQIAKALLDGDANPNQANGNGGTALMVAAGKGHSQIAKALLDGGANPNQAKTDGSTALMVAADKGHSQIAKALLDSGANPNQADKDGATALMFASLNWRVDIVKILSDTSDSSWFFATCTTDEMTDDKSCIAYSHPVSFSDTNAAKISYWRDCTTRFDVVAVEFNPPQSYDINEQNIRSLSFLVRGDDKRPAQMQFSTSNLFRSKFVAFDDSAEAVALIERSNNVRIRFPFRRGSKVIKFPTNGATAAIEKARKGCRK